MGGMLMWFRSLHTLVAVVGFSACSQLDFTLQAPPGEFRPHDVGSTSTQASFSVILTLTERDRSSDWPPAAYVGSYEGEDRNSSIQFVLIQNNADDDHLVAGYRVIEDGKEVKVVARDNIKDGHSVKVSMTFANGITTIVVDGGSSREERTNFNTVTPYVSVSSGTATFELVT